MRSSSRLLVVCLLLLQVSAAEAAIPFFLRPGTHRWWASAGMGVSGRLKELNSQLALDQSVGFHFRPGPTGPAVGVSMQESVGGDYFTLEILPRFFWDFELVDGLGLYLSPGVGLGYTYLNFAEQAGGYNKGTTSGTTFQLTLDGKLVLSNFWLLYARLVGIDIISGSFVAGGWDNYSRWDLMLGGGFTF